MITERQTVGKIDVLEDGQLQVREDTIFERDGVEIHRTYHRRVVAPGDALAPTESPRVQAIAGLLWAPQVVTAYQLKRAAAFAAIGLT